MEDAKATSQVVNTEHAPIIMDAAFSLKPKDMGSIETMQGSAGDGKGWALPGLPMVMTLLQQSGLTTEVERQITSAITAIGANPKLTADVDTLKADIVALKTDVQRLNLDVATMTRDGHDAVVQRERLKNQFRLLEPQYAMCICERATAPCLIRPFLWCL